MKDIRFLGINVNLREEFKRMKIPMGL